MYFLRLSNNLEFGKLTFTLKLFIDNWETPRWPGHKNKLSIAKLLILIYLPTYFYLSIVLITFLYLQMYFSGLSSHLEFGKLAFTLKLFIDNWETPRWPYQKNKLSIATLLILIYLQTYFLSEYSANYFLILPNVFLGLSNNLEFGKLAFTLKLFIDNWETPRWPGQKN